MDFCISTENKKRQWLSQEEKSLPTPKQGFYLVLCLVEYKVLSIMSYLSMEGLSQQLQTLSETHIFIPLFKKLEERSVPCTMTEST